MPATIVYKTAKTGDNSPTTFQAPFLDRNGDGTTGLAALKALVRADGTLINPTTEEKLEACRVLLAGGATNAAILALTDSVEELTLAVNQGSATALSGQATTAPAPVIGAIAGVTGVCSVVPTVQAAAYAAGQVIGGKLTLTDLARIEGGTGAILTADVFMKIANANAIDLLIFHSDPAASTFTDKAALSLNAADFDKLSGVIHITDWTSLGTPSLGQALAVGMGFKVPAGTKNGYLVPVARGSMTFASTADVKIAIKSNLD